MMQVLKIVEEFKQDINRKNELLEKRRAITNSIKSGEDFFIKESSAGANPSRLVQGATLMVNYIKQLKEIDDQIFAIDSMTGAKLEIFLGNFVAKIITPEKVNEAGDMIAKKQVTAVPFRGDDPDALEITIEDLWILKILKQAVGYTNVELVPKEKYYNENNR